MAKPLIVVYIRNANREQIAAINLPESIKEDYHILVLSTRDESKIEVFYESGTQVLDSAKLEELLKLSNSVK